MKLGKSQREKEEREVASIAAFRLGLLLFGKRNDNGKWTLPGGHLNPGEDPKKGAVRELIEETGLKPSSLEPLGEGVVIGRGVRIYAFRAEVDGSPDGSDDPDEECSVWRWVDPQDIPQDILSNLHSPKNVTLQLLGCQEEDDRVELTKAQRPEDFRSVTGAITREGRRFVDHTSQMHAHPPEHNPDVEFYRQVVVDGPKVHKKQKVAAGEGITRKVIYKTEKQAPGLAKPVFPKPQQMSLLDEPEAGTEHLVPPSQSHPGQDAKFMVKPYHEGVVRRLTSYQKHPIQGWAEMANQALYHAGGIGHLHQHVHVAEHDMGPGHEKEPALVVKMGQDLVPIADHHNLAALYSKPETQANARKIGMMDFLTNNLDRHAGNLMVSPDGARVLVIDHSRSFQYINNHDRKWDGRKRVKAVREFKDKFANYINHGHSSIGDADRYHGGVHYGGAQEHYTENMRRLENYKPVFDWWGENSDKIKSTMRGQLQHIKDPDLRAHIQRNFDERTKWLDERAKIGIENYGLAWHHDHVPQYHEDQVSEQEREDAINQRVRAAWEKEQAQARVSP